METSVHAIIYSRPGCHLCDEMKEAIHAAGCAQLYVLEEVDIESDQELLARYRYEIPVLCINGVEAFRHRVRPDEFKAYVTSLLDQRH